MTKNIRTYSELLLLPTFKERFDYLKLDGKIGEETFGSKRYINQEFYHSYEWLSFRDKIIIRDNGCDLGIEGFEIYGSVLIHHINPIACADIIELNDCVLDPENAICVSLRTHNAIHYGNDNLLTSPLIERMKNDTVPWKTINFEKGGMRH